MNMAERKQALAERLERAEADGWVLYVRGQPVPITLDAFLEAVTPRTLVDGVLETVLVEWRRS